MPKSRPVRRLSSFEILVLRSLLYQPMVENSIQVLLRSSQIASSHLKRAKVLIGELLKLSHLLLLSMKATTCVSRVKMLSAVPSLTDTLMFSTKTKMDSLFLSTMLLHRVTQPAPLLPLVLICQNMLFSDMSTVMPQLIQILWFFGRPNLVILPTVLKL